MTVVNQSARIREIDVTSYAEIVLAPPADDLAHPAFGKLFLETEYLADSAALLCHRRPRDPREPAVWAMHVLSLEGRPQGPVEWETDRARFLGRGRDTDGPAALDGRALSGTTGIVLDPILSLRQRIRLVPGASVRLCFATGIASDRETAEALAQKYRDPSAAVAHLRARVHARAERPAPSRHLERRGAAVRAAGVARAVRRRLAARRRRDDLAPNELGQAGLWPHGISGDLPILLVRVVGRRRRRARAPGAAGAGILAPEGAERRRRHPQRASVELSGRDARAADGAARQRAVADVEAPVRRRVPAARRSDRQGGAHAARGGRARGRSAATAATCAPSSTRRIRSSASRRAGVRDRDAPEPAPTAPVADAADRAAADDAGQRPRRLHRRRPRLRDRARRRPGNAAAVGRTSSPTRASAPS